MVETVTDTTANNNVELPPSLPTLSLSRSLHAGQEDWLIALHFHCSLDEARKKLHGVYSEDDTCIIEPDAAAREYLDTFYSTHAADIFAAFDEIAPDYTLDGVPATGEGADAGANSEIE